MTSEEVRKLYHAAPFRPFDIILPSGRKVRVDHPEFMALSPDEDVIVGLKEFRNGARNRKR